MKCYYTKWLYLTFLLIPFFAHSQLNNGGITAYFGIDGDTRDYYAKYGPVTGMVASDDWFSFSPSGKNVIDSSNSLYYRDLLSAGNNIGFSKRMSVPLFSKVNGKLWLDAAYGRDFLATSPMADSTAFTIACKNGEDPNNWVGGTTNLPDKNDLVDLFAHMRRDGTNIDDSLWLFSGVSTEGTAGSRYFDIELYRKTFTYNSSTGVFYSAGTDAGHTQWLFDASGNVTQMGDMILAVNYSPGSAPIVDVRIWVSQATFGTATPANFSFGPVLDGETAGFGYASVLSKSGSTAFGAGIANYSSSPDQDTTFATPWGTEQSGKIWDMQYQSLQLIEIGLNLTRIGLDPALYKNIGLSPCTSMFASIFFKSRSSNSFVSNMQDFMTPIVFQQDPVMDFSLKSDTLRCNQSTGMLSLTPNSTAGYYTWQTPNGIISSSNSDSTQVSITQAGTYIVSASPIQGCPVTRMDTLVVPIDTFPPVASIFTSLGPDYSYIQLYGGSSSASNYPTPFGGSKGLLWDWSGPSGFTSTVQNPTLDTTWGDFQLIVTEIRNGCKDTAVEPILFSVFSILANNGITLEGNYNNSSILLKWQGKAELNVTSYTIEKSINGKDFKPIGTIKNTGTDQSLGTNYYNFRDNDPNNGNNFYRIRIVTNTGAIAYSNITWINAASIAGGKAYLTTNPSGKGMALVYQSTGVQKGTIVIYSISGEVLGMQNAQLNTGMNILPLESDGKEQKSVKLVSLYLNNQRVFTGKMLY